MNQKIKRRVIYAALAIALVLSLQPTPKAVASTLYKIGDKTPSGGTIFYILPPETQSLWHYLEVAPNNWNQGKPVYPTYRQAEAQIYTYKAGDWYIPSEQEFQTLYTQYKANRLPRITIQPGRYWTSTGTTQLEKITSLQVFSTTTKKTARYTNLSSSNIRVRPIRYLD